jgi:diamine N-acetyltransferase
MSITRANTVEQYAVIEALARRIVPDFYAPYFERETAEYLVESAHTAEALEALAGRGYRHYLIESGEAAVGYFSLLEEGAMMLLSHFYLLEEYRGRGLGQEAMDFIHLEAETIGVQKIELFVLRRNKGAVGLYQKNGYIFAAEVMTRLGNGALLKDYLMRKLIDN